MKRFVSLALAAAMTLSLVPVSAFAATDNRITTPVLITKGDVTGKDGIAAGELVIVNDKNDIKVGDNIEFELNLTGGEWISDSELGTYLKATTNTFDANAAAGGVFDSTYALYTINTDGDYERVTTPVAGTQYIKVEKGTSGNLSGLTTYTDTRSVGSFKTYAESQGFEVAEEYTGSESGDFVVYSVDADGNYVKQTPAAADAFAYVVTDANDIADVISDAPANAIAFTALEGKGVTTEFKDSYTYSSSDFTSLGVYGTDYVVYESNEDADTYTKVEEGNLSSISAKDVYIVKDADLSKFDPSSNLPTFTSAKSAFGTAVSGASCTSTGVADFTYTAPGDELDLVDITRMSDTKVLVEIAGSNVTSADKTAELRIQLGGIEATGDKIEVAVTPISGSAVSASTLTVGTVTSGATLTTTEKAVDISENEVKGLNPILIEETNYNTFIPGKTITLKLNSGFKFVGTTNVSNELTATTVDVLKGNVGGITAPANVKKIDERTVELTLGGSESTKATAIKISGLEVKTDGAKAGDVAEITVSGAGTTKQSIEVGKVVNYGVTVTAEDKDLPIIYSGVIDNDLTNNETLELTIEESTPGSWLSENRTTTIKLPEGVKFAKLDSGITVDGDNFGIEVIGKNCDNVEYNGSDLVPDLEDAIIDISDDRSEIYIKGLESTDTVNKKMKFTLKFTVNVAPDFTGDIAAEVSGAAVGEAQSATIAKAVAPVSVEAEKTSVAIDYRNVDVADITVTEAAAGIWEKGQKVVLEVDKMSFESGIKAEVVEGDGEIQELDVDGGRITITVKSESSKTPMKIKLSGVSLYLERSLPAGDYALKLKTAGNNATINDNASDSSSIESDDAVMFETYIGSDNKTSKFNVGSVTAIKDYVTVSTAGRDQGTTFTTEVKVTIDSTTLLVDGKEVTLDVPAYLSAEGWTMLPVRAVTEALASASNSQPVDWIAGNPGTIMIYYGDKTVAMTLGSTTMYINGTPVPMSTAPVIVNDRAFLPMRDLGRALGLSDNQIVWDAATRTATFNPATTTAE